MKVDILYLTYNRLECTQRTLPKLLDSSSHTFNLTICDNGSTDGTIDYLEKIALSYRDQLNLNLILNRKNEGVSKPTNAFWETSEADLIGKIDNDILVEYGWLDKLIEAHRKMPHLAVAGGFHFPENIFNEKKCLPNIYQYNGVKIIRQPHIGGNYLAKKLYISKYGLLDEPSKNEQFKLGGWTAYQERLSKKGLIIGYYFPLIFFKHLHIAENKYYKLVRKMSRRKYLQWEKKVGKKMLYTQWQWPIKEK